MVMRDIHGDPLRFDAQGISAVETVAADGVEYCTVYTGAMTALIAAGVAIPEQFPIGPNGELKQAKSGGYKGFAKNPSQRWQIRRRGRHLFEVHRWHEPRPVRHAFERFMGMVLAAASEKTAE